MFSTSGPILPVRRSTFNGLFDCRPSPRAPLLCRRRVRTEPRVDLEPKRRQASTCSRRLTYSSPRDRSFIRRERTVLACFPTLCFALSLFRRLSSGTYCTSGPRFLCLGYPPACSFSARYVLLLLLFFVLSEPIFCCLRHSSSFPITAFLSPVLRALRFTSAAPPLSCSFLLCPDEGVGPTQPPRHLSLVRR